MRYAIISDIHGNLPAFEAVLTDAKAHGIDKYLLIGDYASNFPWGNAVMDIICGLPNAVVVKGNGEDYLINIKKQGQTDFSHKQFGPVYWAYNSMSAENLDFIMSLPETITINDNDTNIHLVHASNIFFRAPKINLFHSELLRKAIYEKLFPIEEYAVRAKAAALSRPDVVADIETLPKGIYLFGHNHLQFHMEHNGRIFINPGSCGEPLDLNTNSPYTILDTTTNTITERRVKYDIQTTRDMLNSPEYTAYAPMWNKVMKLELLSGEDYMMSFVLHIVNTAKEMGCTTYPVTNDIFDVAAKTWDADKI